MTPMEIATALNDCRTHRDNEHDAAINGVAFALSMAMLREDETFDLNRFRTLAGCPSYQQRASK